MLSYDLRFTFRQLIRQAAFSLTAVGALALGIGANTAVFSFVSALLLRPLPYPDADQIVTVESVRGGVAGKLTPREWEELARDKALFDSVAGWYPSQYNYAGGGDPVVLTACMTTASLFEVFRVPMALGEAWSDAQHRDRNPALVLSHALWKNRFGGGADFAGRSLQLDFAPYLVTGVAGPGFDFPSGIELYRAAHLGSAQNWDVRSLFGVARLQRGVTAEQARRRMEAFAERMEREFPETNRGLGFRITPLRQAVAGDVQPYLLLTLGLAGAVLLIACSNLANLLLARALARRKEVTIRAALGAGRRRIALLFLAESWTVAIAGGLAGLALAHWWVGLLKEAFVPDFPSWMAVEIDARALLFSLAVTAIAGTLAGLAPAIAASRVNLSGALNEGSRGSSEGAAQAKLRSALVVIQVALAAALLALSGLLVKSVWRLQDADPGFRKSGMLTFRTDPPWARYSTVSQTAPFYRQALEALGALPGVEAAAANHSLPLALNQNYGKPVIEAEGQTLDEVERNPFVNVQIVSPNYFRAMEIPIRLGRAFDEGDRLSSPRVAVLSRPVAERLFGAANPIGARIRVKGLLGSLSEGQQAWFTVIGVSEAVRSEHIAAPPGMDIYFSNQQQFAGDTFFILRTARPPGEVEREAARAIRGIDPAQPIFDFRPLEERVNGTIWQRRLAGRLSSLFGALAILLAGLGIYAVLAYGVLQRTREMGIRLALGSTPGQLRRLIVRQGLSLVAPGSVLGLASAALASGHLAPLLHGVSPFDPAAYSAALALVLSMGVLACWLPALRASRTDPGTALRQD